MNGVTAPIFVLTNNLAGETEYALLKNGADDYVRKAHNFYPALLVRFENFWKEHGKCGLCLVRATSALTPTTTRLRTTRDFGIMRHVMLKQTQAYKFGVNVMFYAFNQYYHRHYEQ